MLLGPPWELLIFLDFFTSFLFSLSAICRSISWLVVDRKSEEDLSSLLEYFLACFAGLLGCKVRSLEKGTFTGTASYSGKSNRTGWSSY